MRLSGASSASSKITTLCPSKVSIYSRLISSSLHEKQLMVSHLRKVTIIFTLFTFTHTWTGFLSEGHAQICPDVPGNRNTAVNRIGDILLRIHILSVCTCFCLTLAGKSKRP